MDTHDGNDGAEQLSPELTLGRSAQPVTSLHVTDHVYGVSSSRRGDGSTDKVLEKSLLLRQALALCDTTEDELRSLCDGRERVDVGSTARLAADEAEEEGEDDGENAGTGVHVELQVADYDGEGDGEQQTRDPVDRANLVRLRRRIVDLALELAYGTTANLVADGEAGVAAAAVDGASVAGELGDRYTEPVGTKGQC